MKLLSILFFLLFSSIVYSASIFTNAEVDYIFSGYQDGSISFIPKGEDRVNPANCSNTQAYAITHSLGSDGALSILLSAKLSDKKVYFSVRDDICHAFPQTDNPGTFPVVQRVAIR